MQVWTSCGQCEQLAGECSHHPPLCLIGCGQTAFSGDRCLQREKEIVQDIRCLEINCEHQHNPM